MDRRSHSALAIVVLFLAGCVPANSLTDRVEIVNGSLGPIPADKVGLIRTSGTDAAKTVLENERETGWPDLNIAWQDGGCVRLA